MSLDFAKRDDGGRGGIRTPDTLSGTPVFKTGAINHSATLPLVFIITRKRHTGAMRKGIGYPAYNLDSPAEIFAHDHQHRPQKNRKDRPRVRSAGVALPLRRA